MRASEAQLRDVLKTSNRFSIPKYQRPYVWTTEDQSKLWDGVVDQYMILKAGRGSAKPDRFIGAIVLAKEKHRGDSASDPDRYAIVDGQQRLLTISTYLAALRDLTLPDPAGADQRASQHFTAKHLEVTLSSGKSVLLISPQKPDFDAFESIVRNREFENESHALATCYWNAVQHVKTLMGKENKAFRSERVIRALIDRMAIVSIELDRSDNAHRVFYSLNSLGRPLSRADKVKTVFSMLAGTKADELYDSYWAPMQASLVTVTRTEDFLLTRLIIDGYAVNKPQLESTYTENLNRLEGQPVKVLAQAKKLHSSLTFFRRAIGDEQIANRNLAQTIADLNHWGVTPAWPIMTLVVELHDRGVLQGSSAARCLGMVESLLVRRFVCGVPPNDLRSRLTDVAVKLPHNQSLESELRRLLLEPVNRWYDDREVLRQVISVRAYEPRRVKQLLLLFEWINRVGQGVQAPILSTKDYHIDHVMPQSPLRWTADLRKWGVRDVADLSSRKSHVLGNLTPLQGQANASVSNQTLAIKTKHYYSKSPVDLTRSLRFRTKWDERSIDGRGKKLAGIIVAEWKR